METNEKNDGIDPDKVIADSRTIRRPKATVESVQEKSNGESNVDDIQPPEREFVTEQQSEPSQEPVLPAVTSDLERLSEPMISVTAIPKQQSEPTAPAAAPAPTPKRQEQREPSGRRRGLPSYRDVFVSRNEIKHRQCVYISHKVHSLVSSLVRALVEEGGEITVGGYIDKVLYEHLQAYKDDINELYRNRRPELLK